MGDHLRVSDADRDRSAALLRARFAAGGMTAAELDRLLTVVLRARTFGDLRQALGVLAGQAPEPDGGLRAGDRLEARYRRLLALYPARYRRVHEEEMPC